MRRDVCFVELTANFNRFGVAIGMGLVERWGRRLLGNGDVTGWAEKRRQDAGATSDGRALIALEVNSCSSREYAALDCRGFGRPGAVGSR